MNSSVSPFGTFGSQHTIFLFSVLLFIVVTIWYIVSFDRISMVKNTSDIAAFPEHKKLLDGISGLGLFLFLSMMPFIGWIFMFSSQSSSAKIKRQTSKFANGFGTSGKYSLMAFFTGFGMMLGSILFFSRTPMGIYISNPFSILPAYWNYILFNMAGIYSIYVQMWALAILSAAFCSIASASRKGVTIPFIILFSISLLASSEDLTNLILVMMFEIMIFSFVSRAGIRQSRYIRMKAGAKVEQQSQANGSAQKGQAPLKTATPQTVSSGSPERIRISDYENTIVMSGPPSSGKTTFLSYLFKFMPDIEKITGIESSVDPGMELLEEYISKILLEHRFPDLTQKDTVGEVVFHFVKNGFIGKKGTHFRINDIAGEHFDDFKGTPKEIRARFRGTRFEYMLLARAYVIMVDCSEYSNWGNLDVTYSRVLQALFGSRYGKKNVEIAFIFSKADMLPDAVADKSAAQLLEYMRDTAKKAAKLSRNLTAFKICVKTERSPDGDIVPKLDILEGGRKDIVFDPTFNKDFTSLVQWIAEVSGL